MWLCYPIPRNSSSEVNWHRVCPQGASQALSPYRIPWEILAEQGSNFTSQLLAELYKLLHVQPIRTSQYQPQTEGDSIRCWRLWCKGWLTRSVKDHFRPMSSPDYSRKTALCNYAETFAVSMWFLRLMPTPCQELTIWLTRLGGSFHHNPELDEGILASPC